MRECICCIVATKFYETVTDWLFFPGKKFPEIAYILSIRPKCLLLSVISCFLFQSIVLYLIILILSSIFSSFFMNFCLSPSFLDRKRGLCPYACRQKSKWKPVTRPPSKIWPLAAVCLACSQVPVFGFHLTAPLRLSSISHYRQPLVKKVMETPAYGEGESEEDTFSQWYDRQLVSQISSYYR